MKAIIITVCVSFTLVMLITATGAIASAPAGGNGHSYFQHETLGHPHRGAPSEPRRQAETNQTETNQTVWHTWCVEHPRACRIVRRR
jgi:hypothetical protein